jgi:hypothetical protein
MTQLKHLQRAFPAYVKDTVFFFWYSRLVSVLQGYGFYIPPAQTIRDGEPLGAWFHELPAHVQNDVANIFGDLLATFLRSKYSGFLDNGAMAQIVHQHENGYLALYDLLVLAGHPLLQAFPSAQTEPRQQADMRLSDYCTAWGTYAFNRTLYGEYLSDRYFIQQFVSNLHPILRSEIRTWLEGEVNSFYLHDPLGPTFSIDRLLGKILARLTHDKRSHLALQPPRDAAQATQLVRAVEVVDEPSALVREEELFIAAIATAVSRSCFLCNKEHLLVACPLLSDIRKDNFRRKALLRALGSQPSATAGGQSPSKPVHALQDSSPVAGAPSLAESLPPSDPSSDFLPDSMAAQDF